MPSPGAGLGIAAPQSRETPAGAGGGWHCPRVCRTACRGALPGVEVHRPFRLGDGVPAHPCRARHGAGIPGAPQHFLAKMLGWVSRGRRRAEPPRTSPKKSSRPAGRKKRSQGLFGRVPSAKITATRKKTAKDALLSRAEPPGTSRQKRARGHSRKKPPPPGPPRHQKGFFRRPPLSITKKEAPGAAQRPAKKEPSRIYFAEVICF